MGSPCASPAVSVLFTLIPSLGILFNRDLYPESGPNEFARAFVDILENTYKVKFYERKEGEGLGGFR